MRHLANIVCAAIFASAGTILIDNFGAQYRTVTQSEASGIRGGLCKPKWAVPCISLLPSYVCPADSIPYDPQPGGQCLGNSSDPRAVRVQGTNPIYCGGQYGVGCIQVWKTVGPSCGSGA